jgi:hypothetical protein
VELVLWVSRIWCAESTDTGVVSQLPPGAALPVSADLAKSAPVTRLLLEEVIYQLLLLVKTGTPARLATGLGAVVPDDA